MTVAAKALTSLCPHCRLETGSAVYCERCDLPLAVSSDHNYFAILGLSPSFHLTPEVLASAYRRLARKIHPDRFIDRSETLRAAATAGIAALNQAYRTLLEPVTRAEYLLTLAGGPGAADFRSVDPALLAEMMSMREELDAVRAEGQLAAPANLVARVLQLRTRDLDRIGSIASRIDSADDHDRQSLRLLLNGMRYYDNLLAELTAPARFNLPGSGD